jgi:nitroimidazol reductase NimA-like FMN-containing flavoprotein (pyridoxamine 5'-phosphate oxidase superfamily)
MVLVNLRSEKISRFLTRPQSKLLRLAVVTEDETPHISSVWYLWRNGCFYISTSEDRLKVRAIKHNPNVALVVDTDVMPYEGVIVEGVATITKRRVGEITLAIVKRYVLPKFADKQFQDLMRYPRILIKVKPKRALDIMSYNHLTKGS